MIKQLLTLFTIFVIIVFVLLRFLDLISTLIFIGILTIIIWVVIRDEIAKKGVDGIEHNGPGA